jgi:molecular chaperone DnaJ
LPEKKDYYDVLSVQKDSTDDDIKSAYRRLAKRFHPDVCTGDKSAAEESFKEVSEAYEVLMNPDKRALYDRYGHAGIDRSWGSDGFTWDNFSHADDLEDLFGRDLFADFFGFGSFGFAQHGGRQKGASLRISVPITLEDAYSGAEKTIEVPQTEPCKACSGTGAREGGVENCPSCGGNGQLRSARSAGFAQFVTITTCPRCGGAGKRITKPCDDCDGRGNVDRAEKLCFAIPAGADSGLRLRVPGKGEPGRNGGPRGDLFIFLQVEPHSLFRRDGDDIHIEIPISFAQAVFGDSIEVTTLDGKCEATIPKYTQTGTVFRLSGKGMPSLDSKRSGDLYVKTVIKTPTSLTSRQKELLREFARISDGKTIRKGIFGRITGET